jgi:superfamily II DNA or RNA helicase
VIDSYKKLKLSSSYNSDVDDILNEFYIPSLSIAKEYKRIAGFFSSSSFYLAARGLSKFILNKSKMKLLVNKVLEEKDKNILEEVYKNPNALNNYLLEELNNKELSNEIIRNHVSVFGWMLKNELLELKIAFTVGINLFHQKIGIMIDKHLNRISFSGSNNETLSGWKNNIEEFKVFREWVSGENKYYDSDNEKFEKFWSGYSKRAVIINAPDAVKKKLIEIAPKNKEHIRIDLPNQNEHINSLQNITFNRKKRDTIKLYSFQQKAVKQWTKKKYKGILEMATGTGKTYTAFGCINKALKNKDQIMIIISVPQKHLIAQWKKEYNKIINKGDNKFFKNLQNLHDPQIIQLGSINKYWKRDLSNLIIDMNLKIVSYSILVCTHNTLSDSFFCEKIETLNNPIIIIVDEVHGVGTELRVSGLLQNYSMRLGLSATPERWFDDEGTKKIFKYFGGSIFKFGLEEAINTTNPSTGKTFLTPYKYYPHFVQLNESEIQEYTYLSKKLSRLFAALKNQKKLTKQQTILLNKRANIVKSADGKFNILKEIINKINKKQGRIKNTLIYCNPGEQFNQTRKILDKMRLKVKNFTNEEETKPSKKYNGLSERGYILKQFSEGFIDILLAMKCLDEGVDVPPAQHGVLMASSTNPREFIQRRGRLLRYHPNKNISNIYDIIVLPPKINNNDIEDEVKNSAIYKKEMMRYKEFAQIALNSSECLIKLIEAEDNYYD